MSKYVAPEFERPASPKMRSCASTFASRGDPWMTDKQARREYPGERQNQVTLHAVTPSERIEQRLTNIRNKLANKLETHSLRPADKVPKYDVIEVPIENPDIDRWTKATVAPRRKESVTKERVDTRNPLHMKLIGISRRVRQDARSRKVEV